MAGFPRPHAPSAEAKTAYDSAALTAKIMEFKQKMLSRKRQKVSRVKLAGKAGVPAQDLISDL